MRDARGTLTVRRFAAQRADDHTRKVAAASATAGPLYPALLLQAGLHAAEEKNNEALRLLRDALPQFDKARMALYAAVARRRYGELSDEPQGRTMLREATAWMDEQGVFDATRITRIFAPGFRDSCDE